MMYISSSRWLSDKLGRAQNTNHKPHIRVSAHRFSRSSLGTSHKIPSSRNNRNPMLLNRSRLHISWLGNISVKCLTELCFFKCLVGPKINIVKMLFQREETTMRGSGKQSKTLPQLDRQEIKIPTHHDCFGWVASTYIHKDIIILVKVDACRIVGKNGVLFFWWWRGYIVDLGPYKKGGGGGGCSDLQGMDTWASHVLKGWGITNLQSWHLFPRHPSASLINSVNGKKKKLLKVTSVTCNYKSALQYELTLR